MMPDLQSSLLCDDVRQERNGKFILIGIFEGLGLPEQKPVCPKVCLVNRWCMGKGTFTQKSRIVGPDDTTIIAEGQPVTISLESDRHVATTVEVFMNIPFKQEGDHWIEVQLDQQLRLRYPLRVRFIPPRPVQQPPCPSSPQEG